MQKRSATWEHKQYASIYWLISNEIARKIRLLGHRKITVLETRKQRGKSEVLNETAKIVLKWLSKKREGQILNF